MIAQLYDCFKHWSEKGSVYIISDPHFEDSDCKLMDGEWISPEEHIALINAKVRKNDTLICLGDCGNVDFFKQIKAHKVLIMGNHDDKAKSHYLRTVIREMFDTNTFPTIKSLKDYLTKEYPTCSYYIESILEDYYVSIDNNLFDEIYEGVLFIGPKIVLSHEHVPMPFAVNIHGHEHDGSYKTTNEYGIVDINLASNVCGYSLFDLGKEIKQGLVSKVDTIHRITIDNATERKKKRQELS